MSHVEDGAHDKNVQTMCKTNQNSKKLPKHTLRETVAVIASKNTPFGG